ncbi:MAG TPA: SAM-dependent chlorinase/fluorinase [Flavobacteriales bacterium]|nr:SAM-dependent chlorinase/fluorinase [Flavobacteriales bacterium]
MAIITLTTDMGTKDHYVAVVKAAIMQQEPSALVVDITHEVRPFHTAMAAHVARNAFPAFPAGSIHIIGVNPEADAITAHVVARHEGHHFITADNGILPLVFEGRPYEAFELTMKLDDHHAAFPTRSVFVKAACHLARGGTAETIGRRMPNLRELIGFAPSIQENAIVGRATYVDHYGNVMTNIKRSLFDEMVSGRSFRIRFGRTANDLTKIHTTYSDVSNGVCLAFFNASGHLEIAVNKGSDGNGGGASRLLGLHEGDAVRVEFSAKR